MGEKPIDYFDKYVKMVLKKELNDFEKTIVILCLLGMILPLFGCSQGGYEVQFSDGSTKNLTIEKLAEKEEYADTMEHITGQGTVSSVKRTLGGSYSLESGKTIPYAYNWEITLEEGIVFRFIVGYNAKGSDYDLAGNSKWGDYEDAQGDEIYGIELAAGDVISFSVPLTKEGTRVESIPRLVIELKRLDKVDPRVKLPLSQLNGIERVQ